VTVHPERHMLNIRKYKEELLTWVKPLLEVYRLDKNSLVRQFYLGSCL
jgi:hypothetical protein